MRYLVIVIHGNGVCGIKYIVLTFANFLQPLNQVDGWQCLNLPTLYIECVSKKYHKMATKNNVLCQNLISHSTYLVLSCNLGLPIPFDTIRSDPMEWSWTVKYVWMTAANRPWKHCCFKSASQNPVKHNPSILCQNR